MKTILSLIFPGQGAHGPRMIDGISDSAMFRARYEEICDRTDVDILRDVAQDGEQVLKQNLHSSMLTVLVSSVSLDFFDARDVASERRLAGYSVGQWSAMYAAGMIAWGQLVDVIAERARLMDECARREPGAMLAVIGVAMSDLEELITKLQAQGHRAFIANYNCPGQYSVSVSLRSKAETEEALVELKPKKLVTLAVGGPWHCPILRDAEAEFALFLQGVEFRPPLFPVVDNLTGRRLPDDLQQLRANLARHLSEPVRWESGIRGLIAEGCAEFVEIGYGNMLTKFGFFIDREVKFSPFHH